MSSLLLALTLAAAPSRPPIPPQAESAQLQDRSIEDWARMLRGSDRADRRLAARELLRQVRAARRAAEHARAGSVEELESRQSLAHLREALERPCTVSLEVADVARACAQMLGLLELSSALPALEAALAAEPPKRTAKAIVKAIEEIEAAGGLPPGAGA